MSNGLFEYEQSTGTFVPPTEMFRGNTNIDGTPAWEDVDMDSYVVPPTADYDLMVVGFSRPFEQEISKEYQRKGGPTTSKKTSIELEIVSSRGKGRRFLWNFQTWSLSLAKGKNPSNLGRIYKAAVLGGADPDKDRKMLFEELLNKPFHAYVVASDDTDDDGKPKFCKVSKETIRTVSAGDGVPGYDPFDHPQSQAEADERELVAAAKPKAAPEAKAGSDFDEAQADGPGF